MIVLPKRYRNLRRMGAGWSSVIYVGRERLPGDTDRTVIIKRLKRRVIDHHPEVSRPHLINAMKREAFALRQCQHDSIPRFVEWLEVCGDPCIIMEHLPGKTLNRVLEARSPLTWDNTRRVALRLLEILEHIHHAGWIHCDLNPGNILLHGEDVYLLDFGAAQQVGNPPQWEWPLGRHRYMPPEHLLGRTEVPHYSRLCFASDLHQVACLIVYLLTQQESFRPPLACEEYGTDYLNNLGHWMAEPVVKKMRLMSVERRRADAPSGLDHVLSRALEPEINARFTSAKEMKLALFALSH